VRSDLQKLKGVSNIKTDIASNVCEFMLDDAELDLEAKLNEFAKTNSHIAGWSLISPPN
jgi:hypothetical protein